MVKKFENNPKNDLVKEDVDEYGSGFVEDDTIIVEKGSKLAKRLDSKEANTFLSAEESKKFIEEMRKRAGLD